MRRIERLEVEIQRKLDILEKLLSNLDPVYPPTCDCVIKSRDMQNHLPSCPYRMLKEAIVALRKP